MDSQVVSVRTMSTMRRANTAIWRKSSAAYHSLTRTISSCPDIQITTLPNKIRVATDNTPGHFSSVGLYVDAGARHETLHTSGVSHFLDRMAFKVTIEFNFSFAILFICKSIAEHRESVWRANGFSHRLSWWSNNVFFFSRVNDVPIFPCT